MNRFLTVSLIACLIGTAAYGQKNVVLTSSAPYVEWLGGKPDVDDNDICLRLVFDEDMNTLTVSLSSVNSIPFGFTRSVRYGTVFNSSRKLKPERLPYKVDYAPSSVFRLHRPVRRNIGHGCKNHSFKAWLEYDGMEPVPGKSVMPDDSLVQVFKVDPAKEKATVRVRDIFMLVRKGATPRKWNKFNITEYQDAHSEYEIVFSRNPCRGQDEQIAAMNALYQEVSGTLQTLSGSFPEGIALTLADLETFQNLRNKLLQRFTRKETETECPELQEAVDKYNLCVDSLLNMTCTLSEENKMEFVRNFESGVEGINSDNLLSYARQLDQLTASWRMEKSKAARQSIKLQCERIISEASKATIGRRIVTDEDRNALHIFIEAKNYYTNVCR